MLAIEHPSRAWSGRSASRWHGQWQRKRTTWAVIAARLVGKRERNLHDLMETIPDWDGYDIEQAIIYLGFIFFGLGGIGYLVLRMYAFFFPEKGPFP